MAPSDVASKIYSEAVVVGGINVSNRESTAVFDSLQVGGVTAIHATIAVWGGGGCPSPKVCVVPATDTSSGALLE